MKELKIKTPTSEYPIYITEGFDGLAAAFETAGFSGRKLCIITDSNVAPLYLDKIKSLLSGYEVSSYVFRAGEESKNLDTISDFYKHFIDERLDRKSVLVALGGGVTGDMTGFAAATYMRGIPFVQIPTTLLAQVDSSVGGKTGVDFLGNKNMVGAFYQPSFVYINSQTLSTLPKEQVASGMAEAVKTAYIIDKDLLAYFNENAPAIKALDPEKIGHVIYSCCKAKAWVVNQDEKESGLREILNFGHTFGHAVEKLSGFKLLHGECVAIGMAAAMHLTAAMNKTTENDLLEAEKLLQFFDLPIRAENFGTDDIYKQMFYDKKTKNGKLNIIVLEEIGRAYTEKNAPEEAVKAAIAHIAGDKK